VRKTIIIGTVSVIAIVAVSLPLSLWIASMFGEGSSVARAGQLGDAFGLSAALFAGLGSLGIVIVLAYDLNHRKEEFRPYLAADLVDARLTRSSWSGAHYEVALTFTVRADAATPSPALNLKGSAVFSWGGNSRMSQLTISGAPVGVDGSRDGTGLLTADGSAAESLMRTLLDGQLRAGIVVDYAALNGTHWRSQSSYSLSIWPSDQGKVEKTLNRSSGEAIEPSSNSSFGDGSVKIVVAVVPDSWSQTRISR
jgi:hypothetical protein